MTHNNQQPGSADALRFTTVLSNVSPDVVLAGGSPNEMRISPNGITCMGKTITDAGEAYTAFMRAMNGYLPRAVAPSPQVAEELPELARLVMADAPRDVLRAAARQTIRDAIAASRRAAGDFVLVPRKLTDEMRRAAREKIGFTAMYEAAVAAAPASLPDVAMPESWRETIQHAATVAREAGKLKLYDELKAILAAQPAERSAQVAAEKFNAEQLITLSVSGDGEFTLNLDAPAAADLPPGEYKLCINTPAAVVRAPAPAERTQPELTVWYGTMPESNGKSNFTAILKRKGSGPFDTCHITIDRSEYPDRVRYEADRVRWLIGEIEEEPFILDYDADKHSGYVGPTPAAEGATQADTREPWIPYLSDRADGCAGHYAIARWNPDGYREVWNLLSHRWAAFSDDVLTLDQARDLLRKLVIPTARIDGDKQGEQGGNRD